MIKRLLPKGEFGKNVMVLMTGTSIAQVIPFLISPILTRLYSPSEFGVFAFYLSIVLVISIVATGRYEQAIMLPSKDEDAGNLLVLSIAVAVILSMAVLVAIVLFGERITLYAQRPDMLKLLYFIPLSIFLTALYQSLRIANNRGKRYSKIATSRVAESATNGGLGVLAGIAGIGVIGLILASLISAAVGVMNLFIGIKYNRVSLERIICMAKRYSRFPLIDVPASLFNTSAQQTPNFLFAPLFGAVFAGYYFLIQRVFMMPIKLLSTSMAEVFRQEAARNYNDTGRFDKLYISVFKKLFAFAVVPFLLLMVIGEWMFGIVFGAEWAIAGYYAQILAPMFMLKFIVSPLSYAFYVVGKLHYDFCGQVLYFMALLGSICIGYYYEDFILTIKMISLSGSIFYIAYLVLSYRFSKGVADKSVCGY